MNVCASTITLDLMWTNHKNILRPFRINFENYKIFYGRRQGKLVENFSKHSVVLTVHLGNPIHHVILWIFLLYVLYAIHSRADI